MPSMPTPTHEVTNQSSPFIGRNLFAIDAALQAALRAHGAVAAPRTGAVSAAGSGTEAVADPAAELYTLGARLGEAEVHDWARLANAHPPVLHNYDRFGNRIDEIEFHPAWHALMRLLIGTGVHAAPWARPGPGAQALRAAKYFLYAQVENGTQCPVTMTFAAVPVLQQQARNAPALQRDWLARILAPEYDPSARPASAKRGLLLGMGMTEKQGGSDVRANTSHAERVASHAERVGAGSDGYGDEYRITGHKWFFSAPQCDGHLVLAQTARDGDGDDSAGPSCFLVPRYTPDGRRNAIAVQRLKDKLGNRSNASSEVEFVGATGWLIGAVGRGIPTILQMGNHTRMDCAIASAGIMRAVLTQALHHARERHAFGRRLVEHALMSNVLADLALEVEAATHLVLRLARAYDRVGAPHDAAHADPAGGAGEQPASAIARALTPAAKYWVCKRLPMVCAEAMEVMGGNGYVEEGAFGGSPLARFYREAPLNSIWEGAGNIICLDLLRALGQQPALRTALIAELDGARGSDAHYDAWIGRLGTDLGRADLAPYDARRLAERIALALQASLLLRDSEPWVAQAFCASRLAVDARGAAFGALPSGIDAARIVARALP